MKLNHIQHDGGIVFSALHTVLGRIPDIKRTKTMCGKKVRLSEINHKNVTCGTCIFKASDLHAEIGLKVVDNHLPR